MDIFLAMLVLDVVVVSVAAIISALFLFNNEKNKNNSTAAMIIITIILAWINFMSMPTNFILSKIFIVAAAVIAVLAGALRISDKLQIKDGDDKTLNITYKIFMMGSLIIEIMYFSF